MDPDAALRWLVEAIEDDDPDRARECLDGLLDYLATWEETIELTPDQTLTILAALRRSL